MSVTITLILSIVSLLFVSWLWSRRRYYSIYAKMPGPLGLPFIGQGLQLRKPEKVLNYLNKLSKEYKMPFMMWLGTDIYMYASDPVTIETVFQSSACTNKGEVYRFLSQVIGNGLFTSKSPRWNKHRRLVNPAFGRKIVESFLPIFNQEANVLISKLTEAKDQSLELYQVLKKSVLEVACQTTMGQKMNFHNEGSAEIFASYTGAMEVNIKRLVSPWLYPDIIYRYTRYMKIQQQAVRTLYTFIDNLLRGQANYTATPAGEEVPRMHGNGKIVNGKVSTEQSDDEGIKKSKSKVLIECLRNYIESGQLTLEDVRDEANVAMAAAFDTTSTALYFVCLCLAIHPQHQDALYKELVTLFPPNGKELNVTLEDLEHMTYTEMVINEAMRLFSPVPMVIRGAATDFQLNDGTVIPQGTQILIDIYNMQRSEEFWGPDAKTFDPEKHFGNPHEQHPFAFIPFTKGLRMCIGYRYALMLMKIIVANIFLNFRVHTDAQIADLGVKGTVSLKLCEYPLFKCYPRDVTASAASEGRQ